MENKYCAVLVTTESAESAKGIALRLLRSRLAVCVNIVPKLSSMYWWHGKIEECQETLLIIKTHSDKFKDLAAEVKKLHSYEVPEILALPIADGNPDYLEWMDSCLEGGSSEYDERIQPAKRRWLLMNKKFSLRDLLKIAAAASLSAVLMITVRLPLVLSAPFLTYDFSEIPALLMGILWGPAAGILTVLIKDAVFLLFCFSPLELLGIPADLTAGFTLVGVTSYIYNSGKSEGERNRRQVDYRRLFWASLAGILSTVIVMIPVNILLYWLMSRFFADFLLDIPLWKYVAGAAMPFNFLKGCLTCLIVSAGCGRLFFLKK